MKNTLLPTSFLTFLLSISLFLGFTPRASADSYLQGGQRIYNVGLYAVDSDGYIVYDHSTPSGYAYNTITIFVNNVAGPILTNFNIDISNPTELNWHFENNVPWYLKIISGADYVSFEGYSESNFLNPISYEGTIIGYTAKAVGTVLVNVTSPGVVGDGSDSTSYTMTLNIWDNSPKPTTANKSSNN